MLPSKPKNLDRVGECLICHAKLSTTRGMGYCNTCWKVLNQSAEKRINWEG